MEVEIYISEYGWVSPARLRQGQAWSKSVVWWTILGLLCSRRISLLPQAPGTSTIIGARRDSRNYLVPVFSKEFSFRKQKTDIF